MKIATHANAMALFLTSQLSGSKGLSDGIGRFKVRPSEVMRYTEPERIKESCFCRSFMERLEKLDISEDAPGVSARVELVDDLGDDGMEKAGWESEVISNLLYLCVLTRRQARFPNPWLRCPFA